MACLCGAAAGYFMLQPWIWGISTGLLGGAMSATIFKAVKAAIERQLAPPIVVPAVPPTIEPGGVDELSDTQVDAPVEDKGEPLP